MENHKTSSHEDEQNDNQLQVQTTNTSPPHKEEEDDIFIDMMSIVGSILGASSIHTENLSVVFLYGHYNLN